MADELVVEGAPEAPASEDLRSVISKAIAGQRESAAAAPAAEAAPVEATNADGVPPVEGAKPAGERVRDQHGRFAPEKGEERPGVVAAPVAPVKPGEQTADGAPAADAVLRPPLAWSPTSKAKFDALDPGLKADIVRREELANQGLAKLQEYKPIERFAEMAKSGGTTLDAALTAYTNTEALLRKDPAAGIIEVFRNLRGIDPKTVVLEVARRLGMGGGQPQAAQPGQNGQPQPQAPTLPPEVINKLSAFEAFMQAETERRSQSEFSSAQDKVSAFFADPKNKYVENVAPVMVDLINQAKAKGEQPDLAAIYETACWSNREVRGLLINEHAAPVAASTTARTQAAATQARNAAKATTGAPAGGSPPSPSSPTNLGLRETIMAAVSAQR